MNEQESAWIAAAQAGSRPAFEALVRMHQGYLRQLLRRLCRHEHQLADDLAQDAFCNAWQGLPQFRGEARFRSWLTRLAYNAYLQHRRRRHEEPLDEDAPESAAPEAASDGALRLDLERALARLREPEREALLMCCYAELSHAEAAAVLGWPLGTVKTQVLRARTKLQAWLAGWRTP